MRGHDAHRIAQGIPLIRRELGEDLAAALQAELTARCPRCHGRGWRPLGDVEPVNDGRPVPCPTCRANG